MDFSKVSLVLSVVPISILLIVFLFCLVVSGGNVSENDMGAVWWLMVVTIHILRAYPIIISLCKL